MAEIDRLIEGVRDAGVPVQLSVHGDTPALAPGVDLAGFRIVQEALTNVIKHAGKASVNVDLRYGERELEVVVTDDGPGTGDTHASPGDGHGIVGMRERVALYGGWVEAAPRPEGGFRVQARLPIGAS